MSGIDELFEAFSKLGVVHPDGRLESKPWGAREFSILDIDGNLVTFNEAGPTNRGTGSPVAGTPA